MRNLVDLYDLSVRLKDKRVCVDDVISGYSSKIESHKSAWTFLIINQLKHAGIHADLLGKNNDVNDYDVWLTLLPMDYKGTFNMFSGASDENAERIKRLSDFKGEIYSLNDDMPDYGSVISSRLKSCGELWKTLDPLHFSEICSAIPRVDVILRSDVFVMGDSHSVSVYVPGSNINRNDGKTLYGALKGDGLAGFIYEGLRPKKIITYFGNIDVRHHLLREQDPFAASIQLCDRYIDELIRLRDDYQAEISPVCLLPIENEERRIPKTGWYKGTPFFGSREDRAKIVDIFNERINSRSSSCGFSPVHWPNFWYTMDPTEYAEKYMEKPGSVHLSRASYQYNFETDNKIEYRKAKLSAALF